MTTLLSLRGLPLPLLRGVRRRCRQGGGALLGILAGIGPWALPLQALQVPDPALERGVAAVGLLLRGMDGEKRVLMIGAHPDDEDTATLTALARGAGARTAYLSLTRGEGGQNLIGPELDEGLGIIRTGELEAARALDGGVQFFTRAFDFGFSKSAPETFGYWPREELVRDAVRVIRRFRPHVVISVFSGTPADGHGHHQVAGMVARDAFAAAGDAARFPELASEGLGPWAPARLLQRFRGVPGGGEIRLPVGHFDPLLGRSHFQLAMESRSQHRSQDMGAAQTPGPRESLLLVVEDRTGSPPGPGTGVFSGIDTTLAALAGAAPPAGLGRALDAWRGAVAEAAAELHALDPERALPSLTSAAAALDGARSGAPAGSPLAEALEFRQELLGRAAAAAGGVVLELRSAVDLAVPGDSVGLELLLWNGGSGAIEVEALGVDAGALPPGWVVEDPAATAGAVRIGAGSIVRRALVLRIPEDAAPSRSYFLEEPRDGEMYRWPAGSAWAGLPRTPQGLRARASFRFADAREGAPSGTGAMDREGGSAPPFRIGTPVRWHGVDKALGEYVRPFLVVPELSVEVTPGVLAWPSGSAAPREVSVRVSTRSSSGSRGTVELVLPPGWVAAPASHPYALEGAGAEQALTFSLTPPSGLGEGEVRIEARATNDEGRSFREGFSVIDYPHIERTLLFRDAVVRVPVFPVRVADGLRVGYIPGSGDDGAQALRQMGAEVEVIGAEELRSGDLSRFHSIVLGVRVYEVRPDIAAANESLLRYAREGGTVIVQYNKYEYPDGGFAPFPVFMARPHDRVTDEGAEVTILEPDHPVFQGPNAIGPDDFRGWTQERGLYFLNRWEGPWTPLLSMADPGEAPKTGSLVVAPVGEGLYVYTGLAFFRQLPEAVPGAFRLLANLASLRAEGVR